jgi:hypothetical protein
MPQGTSKARKHRQQRPSRRVNAERSKPGARYTVGLPATLATEVERYAETVDTSMSKAIAALVRLGLESQVTRKREFLERMKQNLASDDPGATDRLVDEFRDIVLGR